MTDSRRLKKQDQTLKTKIQKLSGLIAAAAVLLVPLLINLKIYAEPQVAKAFAYTELPLSTPFDQFPWKKLGSSIKEQPGLISITWLAGTDDTSIGGFFAFDSTENAKKFVTEFFPDQARELGAAQTARVFDAQAVEDASLEMNSVHFGHTLQTDPGAFVYTEVQVSVPFDQHPWRQINPVLKEQPGLLEKTWLSGINTHTVGGLYAFDTLENARQFAIEFFPQGKNNAVSTRVFDASITEKANRESQSPFYSAINETQEAGVEIIHARDNIYVLISPQGGNVTVSSGEDGTFLIDDQLLGRSAIIQNAAREISDQKIKFILNTHFHFDHTGGNEFFGEKGAILVAHDNVRTRLSTHEFIKFFKKDMPPLSRAGLPVVTVSENMNLYLNKDTIRLSHTPAAHTDGDLIAYFSKTDVLVAGDLIFNGFYPFIDVDHGGSIKGLITGLELLLNIAGPQTVIVPGHGPLMNKQELQTYKDTLVIISDKIEKAINEDKTLEQVIAEKPTLEFDEEWGGWKVSPEDFVTIVYKSLDQQNP
ncbi:MAG: MBL fold metallo-hydrolase [Candidatus Omnitrophota bacterium]